MPTHRFKGVYPATLPPYRSDGKINAPVLQQLIEAQIRAGVNGFYVSGATGEGILQTVEERVESVRLVMEQIDRRCPVIVHVGAVATHDAVRFAKQVAAMGVAAISALPPIFYKVPFSAILDFYKQIVSASGKPILAYYIPGLNGITFTDDEFDQLLEIEHVIGVKFSDYNLFLMQQILDRHPSAVVMNGNDEVFLPSLSIGAHGAIGLTLNIMPSLYAQLYQAFEGGDLKTARHLQYKANRLIRIVIQYGAGGIGALKPLMKWLGFDCGVPRAPLPALDQASMDRMHQQLTQIDFFTDPIYSGWAKDR